MAQAVVQAWVARAAVQASRAVAHAEPAAGQRQLPSNRDLGVERMEAPVQRVAGPEARPGMSLVARQADLVAQAQLEADPEAQPEMFPEAQPAGLVAPAQPGADREGLQAMSPVAQPGAVLVALPETSPVVQPGAEPEAEAQCAVAAGAPVAVAVLPAVVEHPVVVVAAVQRESSLDITNESVKIEISTEIQ